MRHFYWIDPDSIEIQLGNTAQTMVADYSGLGYAPLEHFLQGVPSQHRQLCRGLKFRPRTIQLAVWDFRTSISAQDTRHTTLLAALNADRGEGILKIVLNDGTERRIKCFISQGPDFDSEGRRDWFQAYLLRFLARDPFLYDPSQKSESNNFNGATPVDIAVTNSGHIGAYPVITIATAAENPKIELVSTGEDIEFESYTVPGGENLTVDCWAGTVQLDAGTDKIGELAKASTLFYIPRGAQTLRLTAAAGTTSLCTITWYDRFLGI